MIELMFSHVRAYASWALRCGLTLPHRASQQASTARQAFSILPVLAMLFFPTITYSSNLPRNEPQGWQWYNEHQEQELEVSTPPPVQPALSATERKKRLQKITQEALDKAILDSSPENSAAFMRWQNFWTEKAGDFTQNTKEALLLYPELDYNLKYSHYNGTVKDQMAMDREREKTAIAKLSSQYGIFFFYRGKMPLDTLLGSVINSFAKDHHVSIIPISVDGSANPALPYTRPDTGQSKTMGIKHFPALFLVDPKRETYRPLAYGFITPDDLSRQFLNVATGFKSEY